MLPLYQLLSKAYHSLRKNSKKGKLQEEQCSWQRGGVGVGGGGGGGRLEL